MPLDYRILVTNADCAEMDSTRIDGRDLLMLIRTSFVKLSSIISGRPSAFDTPWSRTTSDSSTFPVIEKKIPFRLSLSRERDLSSFELSEQWAVILNKSCLCFWNLFVGWPEKKVSRLSTFSTQDREKEKEKTRDEKSRERERERNWVYIYE